MMYNDLCLFLNTIVTFYNFYIQTIPNNSGMTQQKYLNWYDVLEFISSIKNQACQWSTWSWWINNSSNRNLKGNSYMPCIMFIPPTTYIALPVLLILMLCLLYLQSVKRFSHCNTYFTLKLFVFWISILTIWCSTNNE